MLRARTPRAGWGLSLALVVAACGGDVTTPPDPVRPSGIIYTGDVTPGNAFRVIAIDVATQRFDTLAIPFGTVPFPTVSPDGEWLAFTELGKVIIYKLSTGLARDITNSYADWRVTWHPDGQRVLARRTPLGFARPHFVLVNIDRSGETALYSIPPDRFIGGTSAWSPDGRYLYFAENYNLESALLRLDITVPGAAPDTVGPANTQVVAVSPATGDIAVAYYERAGLNRDTMLVAVMNPITQAVAKRGTYRVVVNLAWSPDGRFLSVVYGDRVSPHVSLEILDAKTGTVVLQMPVFTAGSDVPLTWVAGPPSK